VSAPLPPADLVLRQPEILTLAKHSAIERIYTIGREPMFFDRARGGRLNAPDGSYGVLYGAAELRGAFAEVFLREPNPASTRPDQQQGARDFPGEATPSLDCVDGRGPRPHRRDGRSHARLSALRRPAKVVESVARSSRAAGRDRLPRAHDDDAIAFALFEHSAAFIEEAEKQSHLLNEEWFWQLMEAYAVGVAPT
jgi:hypothetical protein